MRYAIGVDVGGTKIEAVLVSEDGVVKKRRRIPTPLTDSADEFAESLYSLIRKVSKRKNLVVGIAHPGYIHEGILYDCPNIPAINQKPLLRLLHRKIPLPIVLENDANCFALAEQVWGAGKGSKNMVGLIIGTGLGSGLILDNKLFKGSRSAAGEIGDITFLGKDIEYFASGLGMVRVCKTLGGKEETALEITKKKSMAARRTIREEIKTLSWLIATLCCVVDPEVVVLGGGVSNAPIVRDIQDEIKKKGFPVKVVRNALGDSSGVLGAAYLALQEKGF